MIPFTKAHAYGNDFLFVHKDAVADVALDALARELCDRHTGIGADGLIVFEPTADGASMRLLNADGGRAEVSGNGVRALGAILSRGGAEGSRRDTIVVHTDAGPKRLTRLPGDDSHGTRQTFRAAMGVPRELEETALDAAGERLRVVTMDMGNPQAVVLGPLPDRERFVRLGGSLERHVRFAEGTNVEFAHVEAPDSVRILIWERGVGPTSSSGTGSCAALVAAAAFGGAKREADVIAPGGTQRVEWRDDGVYLTGWAEILFEGEWLRDAPRLLRHAAVE
jgi:diaminopimelate epimerase